MFLSSFALARRHTGKRRGSYWWEGGKALSKDWHCYVSWHRPFPLSTIFFCWALCLLLLLLATKVASCCHALGCTPNSKTLQDAECSRKLCSHFIWEHNLQIVNVPACSWHCNLNYHQLEYNCYALIGQKFSFVVGPMSRKLLLLGAHHPQRPIGACRCQPARGWQKDSSKHMAAPTSPSSILFICLTKNRHNTTITENVLDMKSTSTCWVRLLHSWWHSKEESEWTMAVSAMTLSICCLMDCINFRLAYAKEPCLHTGKQRFLDMFKKCFRAPLLATCVLHGQSITATYFPIPNMYKHLLQHWLGNCHYAQSAVHRLLPHAGLQLKYRAVSHMHCILMQCSALCTCNDMLCGSLTCDKKHLPWAPLNQIELHHHLV